MEAKDVVNLKKGDRVEYKFVREWRQGTFDRFGGTALEPSYWVRQADGQVIPILTIREIRLPSKLDSQGG